METGLVTNDAHMDDHLAGQLWETVSERETVN